jgi:hypothetical protein
MNLVSFRMNIIIMLSKDFPLLGGQASAFVIALFQNGNIHTYVHMYIHIHSSKDELEKRKLHTVIHFCMLCNKFYR